MKEDTAEIDISICIANYNGEAILEACLASIESQDTGARYELIVHDDASTDGSMEKALALHSDIKAIRSSENVGYCIANRRMVDEASGKQVLLLNNDVELMPGALEALHRAAVLDPDRILSLPEYTMNGVLSCRGMGLDIFFTPYHCRAPGDKVVYAMGACLMIGRNHWHALGGYPPFFDYAAEDLYLCLKARMAGLPTEILDQCGYRHHISKSTNVEGISLQRRQYSERNRLYIINNLVAWPERLLLWPLFKVMWLAEMLLHCVAMRSLKPFAAMEPVKGDEQATVSVLPLLSWRASKLMFFIKRE